MLTKEFIELLHSNNGKELVFEYEEGQHVPFEKEAVRERFFRKFSLSD